MKKFYLHDGVNELGPYIIEELRSQTLKKDTPIWYEGLSEWTTAGNVDELKEFITATPPSFKPQMTATATIQESYHQQYRASAQSKQSNPTGHKLLIWGGIIVLALIGVFVYNQIQQQKFQIERENSINAVEDAKAEIRNHITSYVTAERSAYSYSKLGGIYNLEISVTNSTDYIMDNVKVKITYYKANGGVWDTRFIDFNMINPQTKVTQSIPDTERGTSVDYKIVSIKSNALGLN